MQIEREYCCDDASLQAVPKPKVLAETLAQLEQRESRVLPTASRQMAVHLIESLRPEQWSSFVDVDVALTLSLNVILTHRFTRKY